MRASLFTIFPLLTATLLAQRVTLHIPESAEPVTILLEDSAPNDAGFNLLKIRAAGHTITFHPRNPIACAPPNKEARKEDLTWAAIAGMKLDDSLCFYIGHFSTAQVEHTILAFVSEGFASDAAPVFVVGFDANGVAYKILERNELDLTSLIAKPDGSALLVGKPTLSQVIMTKLDYDPQKDPYATTYDPSAVYVITPGKPAAYSLPQSRTYNLEHYVWVGPKSSESYAVLYNIPGHTRPFVARVQEANAILSRTEQERKQ